MLSFMGGVLHLTAPGAVDGYVPRRNWIVLGITMGVAAFVVVVVFALGWHGLAGGPSRMLAPAEHLAHQSR